MENFTEFLVNNYVWFLVGTGVLVFALIGYLVDTKQKKKIANGEIPPKPKKEKKVKPKKDEVDEKKEELKNMENVSLKDAMNPSKDKKDNKTKEELPDLKEETKTEAETLYDKPLIEEDATPSEDAFIVDDK